MIKFMLICGFLLSELFEFLISYRNIKTLKVFEIKESHIFYTAFLRIAAITIILAALCFAPGPKNLSSYYVGFTILIVALALKHWAISALGTFWTDRLIYIFGVTSVKTGPYRYFNHPGYIARALEILSFFIMLELQTLGFFVFLGFLMLYIPLMRIESNFDHRRLNLNS